jgi:EpsI family protein
MSIAAQPQIEEVQAPLEIATSVPPADIGEAFRVRRALPALALLAVAALFAIWGLRAGDRPAPHADVTTLPTTIGTWRMVASEQTDPKDLAFDATISGALDLDSYTQRVYQDTRTGRSIFLLLEYRTMGRGAFNHRPEACYPAVGYVLSDRRTVRIMYGGRSQPAVAMTADFNGAEGRSHQALLYWFATGSRTESNFWKQQVEMAFGRLHPEENGWAFVRLVGEVPPGDEPGGLAAEQDFTRQAAPSLIQAIHAH